jgi:hypothetical protein
VITSNTAQAQKFLQTSATPINLQQNAPVQMMYQGGGLPKDFRPAFKPGLDNFISQFQNDGGQFIPQPPSSFEAFSINPDQ